MRGTYDYAVALRAVTTTDFMTAESADIPWEVIGKTTSRIVNEVQACESSVIRLYRKTACDDRV